MAGTSSQVTKILVELMLFPLTFTGGAEGSEVNNENKLYETLYRQGVVEQSVGLRTTRITLDKTFHSMEDTKISSGTTAPGNRKKRTKLFDCKRV